MPVLLLLLVLFASNACGTIETNPPVQTLTIVRFDTFTPTVTITDEPTITSTPLPDTWTPTSTYTDSPTATPRPTLMPTFTLKPSANYTSTMTPASLESNTPIELAQSQIAASVTLPAPASLSSSGTNGVTLISTSINPTSTSLVISEPTSPPVVIIINPTSISIAQPTTQPLVISEPTSPPVVITINPTTVSNQLEELTPSIQDNNLPVEHNNLLIEAFSANCNNQSYIRCWTTSTGNTEFPNPTLNADIKIDGSIITILTNVNSNSYLNKTEMWKSYRGEYSGIWIAPLGEVNIERLVSPPHPSNVTHIGVVRDSSGKHYKIYIKPN